jgi:hypothetical protein
MNMPKEGDVVEVLYRGEVELVSASGLRIEGLWHYLGGRKRAEVTVVEPALEVGWHRVVAEPDAGAVFARHWDGSQWGASEASHVEPRSAYRSVQFLGGWDK